MIFRCEISCYFAAGDKMFSQGQPGGQTVSNLQIPVNDDYSLTLTPATADQPSSIILHNHRTGEEFTIALNAALPLREALATAAARLAEIEVKARHQRN
jgi:hypothetical protein